MMRNIIEKLLIIAITLLALTKAQQQDMLKNCSLEHLLDCPNYSLCSKINATDANDTLKCLCLQNFELNTKWQELENSTSSSATQQFYCLPLNNNATNSQSGEKSGESKIMVYIRSPARKQDLAVGILLVLLAATLATAVLYGLKVLSPIKRTKAVYKKIRYHRQNITPLQEMDELELNRRYEMQVL